jgi:hypothetical protein
MRCIICYKKGYCTGYLDFGVTGKDDPVIVERVKELNLHPDDFLSISFI